MKQIRVKIGDEARDILDELTKDTSASELINKLLLQTKASKGYNNEEANTRHMD